MSLSQNSTNDAKSLVYIESQAVEIYQKKVNNQVENGVDYGQCVIENIQQLISEEVSKIAEIQQERNITKIKRQILIGRHSSLLDYCHMEVERLLMQREEMLSSTAAYHENRNWYYGMIMAYEHNTEHQACTQKQKYIQRMKGTYTETLIDDLVEDMNAMNHLMKERSEFIWERNRLMTKILSQGAHPSKSELLFNQTELKDDITSIRKNLQLIECICKKKSAKSQLTGEDINTDLLVEISKHIGYSLQYVRLVWMEFISILHLTKLPLITNIDTTNNKSIVHSALENSILDSLALEDLFSHIIMLLQQLFSSFHCLVLNPVARSRSQASNILTPNNTRKSSILGSESNINHELMKKWSWGYCLCDHEQRDSNNIVDSNDYQQKEFTDEMICSEINFWADTLRYCKRSSHRDFSLDSKHSDDNGGSKFSKCSMKYFKPFSMGNADVFDNMTRYELVVQRMLYKGSPFIKDFLGVGSYFIEFMTMASIVPTSTMTSTLASNTSPSVSVTTKDLMLSVSSLAEVVIDDLTQVLISTETDNPHSGEVLVHDIGYLRSIDEEIQVANQVARACFSSGLIFNSAVSIIHKGLKLSHCRRENYFVQLSWLNALLFALCVTIQGGMTDIEWTSKLPPECQTSHQTSIPCGLHENSKNLTSKRDNYSDKRGQNPRECLVKLFDRLCILRVIDSMNCHQYSLCIQYSSILCLRILMRPSFTKRSDIDNLFSMTELDDTNTSALNIPNDDEHGIQNENTFERLYKHYMDGNTDDIDVREDETNVKYVFSKYLHKIKKEEDNRNCNNGSSSQRNELMASSFPALVNKLLEFYLQYPEIVEQILLLVYDLSSLSSFAKFSFIEANIVSTINRVVNLQGNSVYLLCLCELCQELLQTGR